MQRKTHRHNRVLSPIAIGYSRPSAPYGRTLGAAVILVFIFMAILLFSFWTT
jgi:hypothetical protein